MRIAYFVHGRGRGHASRSRSIVARLRANGHEVSLFGGGDAADVLGADPSWHDIGVTRLRPTKMLEIARRLDAVDALVSPETRVVVSDGDLTGLLFARRRALPSCSVSHGISFSVLELPDDLPWKPLARERLKALPHLLLGTTFVAVHFLPTRSLRVDSFVARPDEAIASPRRDAGSRGKRVLGPSEVVAYFRDDNGAPIVNAFAARGHRVTVFAKSIGDLASGVQVFEPGVPEYAEHFRRANWVVGSTGSNLLSECVYANKPMLALADEGDSEQVLNAIWAERAGVAQHATFAESAPAVVERFEAWVDGYRPSGQLLRDSLEEVSSVVLREVERLAPRG